MESKEIIETALSELYKSLFKFYVEEIEAGKRGWISNTHSKDTELIERLKQRGFTIGDPNHIFASGYTVEMAKSEGMVGVYYEEPQ